MGGIFEPGEPIIRRIIYLHIHSYILGIVHDVTVTVLA